MPSFSDVVRLSTFKSFFNYQEKFGISLPYKEVSIALVGSGVDYRHSDLHNVVGGISFVRKQPSYLLQDRCGTTTLSAGIIGGSASSSGVCGVNPKSSLYVVRVVDESCKGEVQALIESFKWCFLNYIDVIYVDCILVGSEDSGELERCIERCLNNHCLIVSRSHVKNDNQVLRNELLDFQGVYTFSLYSVECYSTYVKNTYAKLSGVDVGAALALGVASCKHEKDKVWDDDAWKDVLDVFNISSESFDS